MNTKELDQTIRDLIKVRNPHFKGEISKELFNSIKEKVLKQAKLEKSPLLISQKSFNDLVTSRNRNLIRPFEQTKLRNTVLACFGLSVGSNIAHSWMMLSRADAIKIIDPDIVDATNLNRLPYSFDKVGVKKIDIVTSLLSDINPFAKVLSVDKVDTTMYEKLIESEPKVDVIVDAIDDFEYKLFLRKIAKKLKLPLLSAADVGDNVILDIERYDTNPDQEYFLGRVKNVDKVKFAKMSLMDRKKLIINLVGFENNSNRMLESLLSIGGNISTWPQLGPTAQIAGGIVALTIKNIILGENIKSGRYYISLDDIFISDYKNSEKVKERNDLIATIKEMMNE